MKIFQDLSEEAAKRLRSGEVAVIPTDTLYGVVCSAHQKDAVRNVIDYKRRANKPGTLVAANIEQFVDLGIKRRYLKAVEHLWPNPLSIVIPVGSELEYLHMGKDSLAVRIPKDEKFRKFLEKSGPLFTTSANPPDGKPAETVEEATQYFEDKPDFYVDGGDLSGRPASTIIRVVDDAVEVLRAGAVTIDEETGRIVP